MTDDRQIEIDHLRRLLAEARDEIARLRLLLRGRERITVGEVEIEVERNETAQGG